jgi:hypothetical protein
LDRTLVHKDFTKEKVDKLLREHPGEVGEEQPLDMENWYLLRSLKPGIRARDLCKQYQIETLREYRQRSREQINDGLKRLAQGLAAEGRLMELEGRPNDAADSYLTAIRLGVATSKGGLLIDSLVGIAIEAIGTSYLEKLALTLNAKQCRQAAAVLETCEAGREPMPTVLARERTWSRRAYGFKWQIARLVMFKSLRQTEQRAVAKVNTLQTRERVLLIQLASRAYELEKGERPKGLADLVPAYLKTIPQDPLTRTNVAFP